LTDPADVARVESKTVIVTKDKYETVPHVKEGVEGMLGRWMSPEDFAKAMSERLPDCMKGKNLETLRSIYILVKILVIFVPGHRKTMNFFTKCRNGMIFKWLLTIL
jgi:hypothetical protein